MGVRSIFFRAPMGSRRFDWACEGPVRDLTLQIVGIPPHIWVPSYTHINSTFLATSKESLHKCTILSVIHPDELPIYGVLGMKR
jgi:hypothetical protein